VVEALAALPAAEPQPEDGVTYAHKIDKGESHIDFRLSAEAVERAIRAFNPAPGAWCMLGGERVKLLAAETTVDSGPAGSVLDARLTIACGTGAVRPTLLQRAGKPAMTAEEALRGWRVPAGTLAE
jgi:methionyl-tRNA formyltransferase